MKRTKVASTKKRKNSSKKIPAEDSPSKLIDMRIKELSDWRGEVLAQIRKVIKLAAPEVVEEWKWHVPVWSYHGIICTGECYKNAVIEAVTLNRTMQKS